MSQWCGFCNIMEQTGALLHPPGWNASIPQVFPRPPGKQFDGTHLYTWVEGSTARVKVLPRTQRMNPARLETGLDPESNAN